MHQPSATVKRGCNAVFPAGPPLVWWPIVRGRRTVFLPAGERSSELARGTQLLAAGCLLAAAVLLASCGGGSRQDAGESSATYTVKVTKAGFPSKQAVARPSTMRLQIENTGTHPIPNLSVTVDSFSYTSNFAGLAANKRPVWVIEHGPGTQAKPPVQTQEVSQLGGGQTGYVNTWALGALAANGTQSFVWRVVPVKAGTYTVHYTVNSGLGGKTKTQLASGAASGSFAVDIAAAPPNSYVNPATGKIVTGTYPPSATGSAATP
jgi:hypothetical protein